MTRDHLRSRTKKELIEMARQEGIPGWHNLRKEELVIALINKLRNKARKASRAASRSLADGSASKTGPATTSAPQSSPGKTGSRKTGSPRVRTPVQRAAARDTSTSGTEEEVEGSKYYVGVPTRDLSAKVPKDLPSGYGKDRIVLMVRDPYWLHCYWEITRQAVQRAEAALGQEWHTARPILRLLDVTSNETTSTSETILRDIEIHGGCNNWYVDVSNPPRSFRIDIGYLASNGQFYVLARSNVVSTPRAGMSDVIDENWADIDAKKADRIYAMSGGFDPNASSLELKQLFEERLRRPLGSPTITSFGSGGMLGFGKARKFWFEINADLIVYGATEPTARVTLQGEPVQLRPDGTFTVRYSLPDSRQIIPAVAASADGIEERTIVLAVERNTKHLEPLIHDGND